MLQTFGCGECKGVSRNATSRTDKKNTFANIKLICGYILFFVFNKAKFRRIVIIFCLFCKIGHGHRDETRRICRLSAA